MPVYEGQNKEEAIEIGLQSLGITSDQAVIDVIEEGKKGFLGMGKKKARVSIEPIVAEEPIEKPSSKEQVEDSTSSVVEKESMETDTPDVPTIAEDLEDEEALAQLGLYLTNITNEMNAPALVKTSREEGTIVFQLDTQKKGLLIGKHGKNLNALQYLAQVFIHRVAKNKLSVVVNVGNYREKRQDILQRLAKNTAEKVSRTGRPVFLEPMPAFERKQIHSALSNNKYVTTHSEGDEPYRYLVVEPTKRY